MKEIGAAGKIAKVFIDSKLTPLIIIASVFIGLAALLALPREEEPQIIVPMIDVFVSMPGASAEEVEQRVTRPMEKLLWEIPGVEYIYSTSSPGMSMAVVRFYVGEDEEKSISFLIWITLGRRESGVVALAIPVTLALTLAAFYLYGYTLNRITLFALIFSIGILVDDAIVVVENVVRHFRLPENEGRPLREIAVEAVDEVGNPTILATLTVIAAILPMAFVGGLMGPYMRPIPMGATAAMIFSMLVAFIVTP